MKNARRDFSISQHLNEAQLIAYLDGELTRAERESSRLHLESCWTCRSSLNEFQGSIEAFLDVRTTLLPEESVFSESRVEQFRQRLARHAISEDKQPVPLRDRFSAAWTNVRHVAAFMLRPRQAATAGVLVVTMVVVMFTDVLNTRVSADTILARADQYQSTHMPTLGQVSRTSMRVERIDRASHTQVKSVKQLGTVTVVRDSVHPAMYVQAKAASGKTDHVVISASDRMSENLLAVLLTPEDAAFEQYLTAEHWVPDLSAAEFRRLGAEQGIAQSSARKEDVAFDASYLFANPSV